MEHTRQEVEAKQNLISALHGYANKIGKTKDGAIVYRHAELIVTLRAGKDELKVTTQGEPTNEE